MPDGIGNAYVFQFFNAICFSIFIGPPALLFFKKLDASATVLGIVTAMPPLLNLMQIPAARYVERVGYKPFVFRGWLIRSFFIFGGMLVAFLPSGIDASTRMALMLFCLFLFNLVRGISVCGVLPWFSQLVPSGLRGSFLSREQICSASAVVLTGLATSAFLALNDSVSAFGFLFLASFLGGMVSLVFLKRIPNVRLSPEASARSREPVPWKTIMGFPPFRKLILYNVLLMTAWAGGGVTFLPMMRDCFAVTDSKFMLLMALATGSHVVGCIWFGKLIDRVGSKPALRVSFFLQIIHFGGWMLIGAGMVPPNVWTFAFQQISWGLLFSLFMVANMRMLFGVVPEMGRSHFFAFHSVCAGLAQGGFPVLWGLLLDGLILVWGNHNAHWLNPYSGVYFGVVIVSLVGGLALLRIHEPEAASTGDFMKEAFRTLPARAIPWIMRRRRSPDIN